jgi:hypothetical protein
MTNNQRKIKLWFQSTNRGFIREEEIPADMMANIKHELAINSGFIGVYIYHSHVLQKDKLVFEGMKLGYYVRSKNPFKWQHKRTSGNE